MNYDSINTDAQGECGYGWYHNYESRVEDYGNTVMVQLNPNRSITFVSEDTLNNVVDGEYEDDIIYLGDPSLSENSLPSEDASDNREEKTFKPVSEVLDGYQLIRTEEGYELRFPDGSKFMYDMDGNLAQQTNHIGQSIQIDKNPQRIRITEPVSGHYMEGSYDEEGRIIRLTDNGGNHATIQYDAKGNVYKITGKRGITNTYLYDAGHRLLVGMDHEDKVFVRNTYDEKGRVLTQDDGDESTKLVELTYQDEEETGNTTLLLNDRLGREYRYVSNSSGQNLLAMRLVQ